ncbi:MAG: dienelactone hydrolase family protein [Acidimicrobiia bacterium]
MSDALDELTAMQRYLGEETIEHGRGGIISRRDMMSRLVGICGSAVAASALLAACGDDSAASTSASSASSASSAPSSSVTTAAAPATTAASAATPATTASPAPTTAPPPSVGKSPLAVPANDPAVSAAAVTFTGPASTIFGYLARPAANTSAKRAGVLVIHEIFGLNDHIRDVTRRLAKNGYLALAVDLTSRAGGVDKVGPNGVSGALGQMTADNQVADLEAAAAYLGTQADFSGKLGITGFCFGGGVTLNLAAGSTKVLAAVPYYGPAPSPASKLSATKAAVLAHYGATDSRINASIPDVEAAMAGKTFQKRVWDGAGHAFNNDTGTNYNETAALGAWKETLDWFAKYLQ